MAAIGYDSHFRFLQVCWAAKTRVVKERHHGTYDRRGE